MKITKIFHKDFSRGDIVFIKDKRGVSIHRLNFKNKPYCAGVRLAYITKSELIGWLKSD